MKRLNLQQGTQGWHDWRKRIIGSSDIAAIMGNSPYRTRRELFYEKKDCWPKGLERKENPFILSKGHAFEEKARSEYARFCNARLDPVCFESDCGRFGASLDGYDTQEAHGVEIKFMGEKDLEELLKHDRFNDHYYMQIQWQMAVANLQSSDLIAGNFDRVVIHRVERDKDWCDLLMEKATEFCNMLDKNQAPPMSKDDIVVLDPDDEYEKFLELKENTEMLKKRVQEQEEAIKEKISILTRNLQTNTAQYGRVRLLKIIKRGNVDYSKIPLEGIDLEKYRKSPVSYWQASIR